MRKSRLLMRYELSSVVAIFAFCLVAGCGGSGDGQMMKDTEYGDRRENAQRAPEPKQFERVPRDVTAGPTGEAPDSLIEAIINDLMERAGAKRDEIGVLRDEAVIWPDGALGCPKPGQNYTQATVDGFWVILEHAGRRYDYRATVKGFFFLCELPPTRLPSEPGTGPIDRPPIS